MRTRIAIADVPRELRSFIGDRSAVPSYRQVYAEVLNGSIPADRVKGRWYINDLEPVIQFFGLLQKT